MLLFQAELDWEQRGKISKMEPEAWEKLKAALPTERLSDTQASQYISSGPWICDLDEAKVWDSFGISLSISKIRGVSYPVTPADAVRDALRAGGVGTTIINNVSVSNVGLYDVRHVHYEEDCCTDKLQGLLNEGWRLLAVCPPNDSRRPTYILGHKHFQGRTK